jgi:hypothetical protein
MPLVAEVGKMYSDPKHGRLLLVTEVSPDLVYGMLLDKRDQEPVDYVVTVGVFRNLWTLEVR